MMTIRVGLSIFTHFAIAACLFGISQFAAAQPARNSLGVIVETPEELARFPTTEKYRAYLPVSVDLSTRFPAVGAQGSQGSCVGWAVGYAARSYYTHSDVPRPAPVSPAYLYDRLRLDPYDCNLGSRISDALNLLKSGAVSIDIYPYDSAICLPPRPVRTSDLGFRIDSWRTVSTAEPDDIKGELARGNPVIVSIRVTSEFDQHFSPEQFFLNPTSGVIGNHALVIVGYDETRQAFRLINSWGEQWGDRGYVWIGYSDLVAILNAAFVMQPAVARPEPSPAPVPGPPPRPQDPDTIVDDVRMKLSQLTLGRTCDTVTVKRSGQGLVISGSVADEADRLAILAIARASGMAVEDGLRIAPWPGCELSQSLGEALSASVRPRLGTSIVVDSLRSGDPLTFSVALPTRAGFLYVVYISADGRVTPLAQPSTSLPMMEPGGGMLVFGDGSERGGEFVVGPPFGREMIVAISTGAPLFEGPIPDEQFERDFLSALRRALELQRRAPPNTAWIGADILSVLTSESAQ